MSEAAQSSTPSFSDFDPSVIPWQDDLVDDVLCRYDYGLGVHQVLLSGTVGSGKSLPAAHLAVRHCLEYPGARGIIGRQALPDLKKTLFLKIKDHLKTPLIQGRDFWVNETTASIRFANGSEIMGYSWADADWESFGSLELSFAVIEEASENKAKYREAYFRLLTRVGRQPHVPVNWIMLLTNPDGPSHWIYEHFDLDNDEGVDDPEVDRGDTKHVYYSRTEDNPFLPEWYISELEKNLDPKMAERLLRGRWIEIADEYIYHSYIKTRNFRDCSYKIDARYPIRLSWDFNIGEGKPLSCVVFQYNESTDTIHYFDEVVVEGMRTQNSCEELAARGILDLGMRYVVHGDATGKRKDTRSRHSDYDIIRDFFANYRDRDGRHLNFEIDVPRANPPIRDRHNRMNAYCVNSQGATRLFVYRDAPTADKAMRLTKPKSGGQYIEDDSDPFQHIGTAMGYGLMAVTEDKGRKKQGTVLI